MTKLLIQIPIIAALIFAFLQITKIIKIKKSKVKKEWLINALVYICFFELLAYYFNPTDKKLLIYFLILGINIWINLIKFTLGLIQNNEIAVLNRVEHLIDGLALFLSLTLLNVFTFFSISPNQKIIIGILYVLISNFISVIHEIIELFFDRVLGKKNLIGPNADDTNFDLLMLFLGSIIGFLLYLI